MTSRSRTRRSRSRPYGLEVLNKVKSNAQTAEIPVVMLTAVSDPAIAQTAVSRGAAEYWVKGHIDYDRLRADVGKFVTPEAAISH